MFRVFARITADEVWQEIAAVFRKSDNVTYQASRGGPTKEILHAVISISDPRERWVMSRYPPINPAFAIAEVVWIMNGRDETAFLAYFNHQYTKFVGEEQKCHGAYGMRLRHHLGIDQLERAYNALKNCPDSRQIVLQIWDSGVDLPDEAGKALAADIPCNVVSMLKIRGGALEWTQILRSNDFYHGLPYNFVQFTALQEVLAGWLGVKVGTYNQVSDSLHLYEDHFGLVNESLPIDTQSNMDSLAFPKRESEASFAALGKLTDRIILQETSASELLHMICTCKMAQPFRNMLCLLCAEGARRRSEIATARGIMGECTNPVYRQLYDRWLCRFDRL